MPKSERQTSLIDWLDDKHDEMVALLAETVNIDSGTYNKAGVDAVGKVLVDHLEAHGVPCERIADERFGDCFRAVVPDGGEGGRNRHVLLLGHRDTVFPDGTVAERPFRIDGDRAYGPGVVDMKGGLVLNTFVLEAFAATGGAPMPLRGLYTSDEEITSPSSRPVIEAEARNALAVFNSEPARESGNVVGGRKGAWFFAFEVTGKAAHSGSRHQAGVSAIEEICRKVQKLHALTDYESGTTVNVGLIQGGTTVNTVAPLAMAEVDLRFKNFELYDAAKAKIMEILDETHLAGTTMRITRGGEFLPVVGTPESKALFNAYKEAATEVGFDVDVEDTGGCSDAGFTSAVGAPTLCGTGPMGGKGHSPEEYCRIDTLVPRGKALALAVLRAAG